MGVNPYVLHTSNPFACHMLTFGCLHLNQNHQQLPGIPSRNGVTFIYVSFVTFILSCWRLMHSPHSCIVNVHAITIESSSSISTPLGPIFLDLVSPFKWLKRELIGMFHDLLAFLEECVFFSTASMAIYNASFIHMPFLIIEGTRFSCGVDLFLFGSKAKRRFFLFDERSMACKSIMLVRLL